MYVYSIFLQFLIKHKICKNQIIDGSFQNLDTVFSLQLPLHIYTLEISSLQKYSI